MERAGAAGSSGWRSVPSLATRLSDISLNDLASLRKHKTMAMNYPRLVKPRECLSPPYLRTTDSHFRPKITHRIDITFCRLESRVSPLSVRLAPHRTNIEPSSAQIFIL